MHAESDQYAVIICEQSVELSSIETFVVVLFHGTVKQVAIVVSIVGVYSSCLSVLWTVCTMERHGTCALWAARAAMIVAVFVP